LLVLVTAVCALARPPRQQLHAANPELLGIATVSSGATFDETRIGGLSGITYDPQRDLYWVISDDRGRHAPARAYQVAIDLSDSRLDQGDVTFQERIFLRQPDGELFYDGTLDPEGIEWLGPDELFIASEGDAGLGTLFEPFVNRFDESGGQTAVLPLPAYFLPERRMRRGIRDNLSLESLTTTPDRRTLYTATENALRQDGPRSSLNHASPARLLAFDRAGGKPAAEYVYLVEPIAAAPILPGLYANNGLVDLQALNNEGEFLALERSYSLGAGHTVRVFRASAQYATDVSGTEALMGSQYAPLSKELLFDFADLGLEPDNIEGMTLGPTLPDGRSTLLFVSDNNFNPLQDTHFLAVALDLLPANQRE